MNTETQMEWRQGSNKTISWDSTSDYNRTTTRSVSAEQTVMLRMMMIILIIIIIIIHQACYCPSFEHFKMHPLILMGHFWATVISLNTTLVSLITAYEDAIQSPVGSALVSTNSWEKDQHGLWLWLFGSRRLNNVLTPSCLSWWCYTEVAKGWTYVTLLSPSRWRFK